MARLRSCAALLALPLLLAACGGGGSSEPTPTPTLTATPRPSATPTATQTPTPTATDTPTPTSPPPAAREPAGPVPQPAAPNTSSATGISLPAGFTAYAIAQGFYRPTSIALSPNGAIYISERHGSVYRLVDRNGDGVFEENALFASGFEEITGLVFSSQGALYVSSRGRITTLRDTDGDTVRDSTSEIIRGLPYGLHQNNGLVFGPDGKLYLTNGSTCDDNCVETDARSATILQANPDGSDLRVFARGLRNPYDLVFDARGRLWATDNGSDAPCTTIDELNLIERGGDYGWPYTPGCNAFQSGIPPVADLGLHTAATGIDQYLGGQFPAAYRGDLFLTLWGSLVYAPQPAGYSLLRVIVNETPEGPRASLVPFGTGFKHPIDVVMDRDGTLLVLDYGPGQASDGKLYRIVYTGG